MATQLPLNDGSSVALDASGNGTAQIGPGSTGEKWQLQKIAVIGNSSTTSQPVANVYINSVSQQNFFDGTQTGNQDSSDINWILNQNEKIIAVFSGGTSGATHTLSIFGTRLMPY